MEDGEDKGQKTKAEDFGQGDFGREGDRTSMLSMFTYVTS